MWVGGEGLLSVNIVDHHTSSHMPASMIDSCSLSWTKWKKCMLLSQTNGKHVCQTSVFNWCLHFRSPAGRVFFFPFRELLLEMHTQACRDKGPQDSLREFELMWHGQVHPLPSAPLVSLPLRVCLRPRYSAAQWARSESHKSNMLNRFDRGARELFEHSVCRCWKDL